DNLWHNPAALNFVISHTIVSNIMRCSTIPYHIIPCHAMPCHAVCRTIALSQSVPIMPSTHAMLFHKVPKEKEKEKNKERLVFGRLSRGTSMVMAIVIVIVILTFPFLRLN